MPAIMGIVRNLYHNEHPLVALRNVTAAFLSVPLPVLSGEEVSELLGCLETFVINQATLHASPELIGEATGVISIIGTVEAAQVLQKLKKQECVNRSESYMGLIAMAQAEIDERGGKILRGITEV